MSKNKNRQNNKAGKKKKTFNDKVMKPEEYKKKKSNSSNQNSKSNNSKNNKNKNNKKDIVFFFALSIITILIILSSCVSAQSSIICYQETANASTGESCGIAYYMGHYFFYNNWTNPMNVIDGNWATYGYGTYSSSNAYVNIYYDKVYGSQSSSVWQIAVNDTTKVNLTIPSSCWTASNSVLEFEIISDSTGGPGGLGTISFYCYTNIGVSTTYIDSWVYPESIGGKVYEEGMVWNITNDIPNVNITQPVSNGNYSVLNITYTATDATLDSCKYSNDTYSVNTSLSGCVFNSVSSSFLINWTQGQHNLTIWAHDTLGNENSTSVSFYIDKTPPSFVAFNNISILDNQSVYIDINATDNWVGVGNFSISYSSTFNTLSINYTSGVITNTTALSPETIIVNVSVTDLLGNLNSTLLSIQINSSASLINVIGIADIDILDLGSATYYGRIAQNYSPNIVYHHLMNNSNDGYDNYLLVTYSELDTIIDVYVNDVLLGTIPSTAGGTGVWKTANFSVSSANLQAVDNDVKIITAVSNTIPAYIDKLIFVPQHLHSSSYFKNNTNLAIISKITGTPDDITLNYTYSNATKGSVSDIDKNIYLDYGTSGNIISLFNTGNYEGYINISVIANSSTVSALTQSPYQMIITDGVPPVFNTITTSLSNVLVGRTYNISLNQTESNPDTVEYFLNGVSQGFLINNGTNGIFNNTISYTTYGSNNISITSTDLAGNSYTYNLNVSVSQATISSAYPVFNKSMSRTNYFNVTSSDTYYNSILKIIMTIVTQGLSSISDLNINTTISDTYPINIYSLLANNSIVNFTANSTNPNWTTDAFDNSIFNHSSYTFTNSLVYKINNSIELKYGNVGVGNERLFWARSQNLTTNLSDVWIRFPLRTPYATASYSVQIKRCLAGHTYGGVTCTSWDIITTQFYSQSDPTYNGGVYPTEDTDGDGTKDTAYFKISSLNSSEVIQYSIDTIVGAEIIWTVSAPSGGGGGAKEEGDECSVDADCKAGLECKAGKCVTIIPINASEEETTSTNPVINFFKIIGSFLDKYLIQPITFLLSSISYQWNDTIGFIVISVLVLVSGTVLFFSSSKKEKTRVKKSEFQT